MTTEEMEALWRLCKAIYGDKAKYQRYADRDFAEMINRAAEIIENQ
jgi:hypothetical protein